MSAHSSKGAAWEALRTQVRNRAQGMCEAGCGNAGSHCDHIYPKSLGGTDTLDNLQWLCQGCNLRKGARVLVRQTWFNNDWFA